MLAREPTESIKSIWADYYKDNLNIVSGVMTAAKFNFLLQKGKESPFFIFPVFRKGGHFILLSQTQGRTNMFTYLEDYKKNPEHATPYFVLTLFDEFAVSKGLVLYRADILDHRINKTEASAITQSFVDYYTNLGQYEDGPLKFNHNPDAFKYEEYVQKFR